MNNHTDAIFDELKSEIHAALDTLRPAPPVAAPTHLWRRLSWGEYALAEARTSRIVGRVVNHWTYSTASTDLRPLGEYLDEHGARRAVEKALMLPVGAIAP